MNDTKTSKAKLKANDRYLKKFDTIAVRLPAGSLEMIRETIGMSANAYFKMLFEEDMKRRGIDAAAGPDQHREEE